MLKCFPPLFTLPLHSTSMDTNRWSGLWNCLLSRTHAYIGFSDHDTFILHVTCSLHVNLEAIGKQFARNVLKSYVRLIKLNAYFGCVVDNEKSRILWNVPEVIKNEKQLIIIIIIPVPIYFPKRRHPLTMNWHFHLKARSKFQMQFRTRYMKTWSRVLNPRAYA